MVSPRFLSFAIPAAVVVFAILGNAATSLVQRGYRHKVERRNLALAIGLGLGLGMALLALAATIYGLERFT